ncbi:hypothetical protein BJ742DRAFT_834543 [Cladochytrium replicatum]|nr:hypothetical protein BJ742DRAFT_834543 [Cladochytrium replicatum]
MAEKDKQGKTLSSGVMKMKFMSRMQESDVRKKIEEERQKIVSESEWVVDLDGLEFDLRPPKYEEQQSFLPFMENVVGRTSFKSFNQKIEKLNNKVGDGEDIADAMPASVTDAEMAEKYSYGAGRNRETGSRYHSNKRDVDQMENSGSPKSGRRAEEDLSTKKPKLNTSGPRKPSFLKPT